jgi:hypothetical protein
MFPRLELEVQDTPFDPSARERIVLTRAVDGQTLYRVFVYLTGRDLPFVKRATYSLHPSVSGTPQAVARTPANPDCRLILWLWGTFPLSVVVEDLKDGTHELQYKLQFDRYFSEATFKQEGLKVQPS